MPLAKVGPPPPCTASCEEPQAKLEDLLAVFTGEFNGLIETLRADLENES